jgi:hypothetical protein
MSIDGENEASERVKVLTNVIQVTNFTGQSSKDIIAS